MNKLTPLAAALLVVAVIVHWPPPQPKPNEPYQLAPLAGEAAPPVSLPIAGGGHYTLGDRPTIILFGSCS